MNTQDAVAVPDCLYCRKDQRLSDLMIEITPLRVSTLFLFKEQTHRGRCVVAYKHHIKELFDLPDSEVALFMQDVAHAARAIHAAFKPAKINYGAYSDKLPHLHFHLVPKTENGAEWGTTFAMMPEAKQLLTNDQYTGIIEAIRSQLHAGD